MVKIIEMADSMNRLHLISSGVYTFAQKQRQHVFSSWIDFTFSGIRKLDVYDPAGKLMNPDGDPSTPALLVGVQGFVWDFDCGPDRENWLIAFDDPGFRYDSTEHKLFLESDAGRVELSVARSLARAEAGELREQFRSIDRDFRGGTPAGILRAEFLTGALLTRMFVSEFRRDDPVERFRTLLDDETVSGRSVSDLSGECGFSRDRMRELFSARYGLTPQEYRMRRRLNMIMHYIVYSDLSIKEIADRVGMRHVTHLYAFLERCGCESPRRLCRKYREGIAE